MMDTYNQQTLQMSQ